MSVSIKNIMVAYDFGIGSQIALREADFLATKFGAKLHIIHVLSPDLTDVLVPKLTEDWKDRTIEDIKGRIEHKVDQIIVDRGEVYQVVAQHARDMAIDLVVVGSHGHSVLGHIFLGSVADRIASFSPCPVLVAHKEHQEKLGKVLLPVGENTGVENVMPLAQAMANSYQASLQLMHAVDSDSYYPLDYQNVIHAKKEKQFARIKSINESLGLTSDPVLATGKAGQEIVKLSKSDGEIGMVCISTHDRNSVKEWLVGSTCEKVVRYAHCQVLVIPTKEQKERVLGIIENLHAINVTTGDVFF